MRYLRSVLIGLALAALLIPGLFALFSWGWDAGARARQLGIEAQCARPIAVTATPEPEVDVLKEYRVKPKHFDTYPAGSFEAVGKRCYLATGNLAACICALWNLEEAMTYDEAKAAPGGPGALLDVLYTACEAKHPAPLSAVHATSL